MQSNSANCSATPGCKWTTGVPTVTSTPKCYIEGVPGMVDDSKCTTLPKPPVCVNPLEKCFVVSGNTITSYLTNDSTGKSCPKNVVIPSTINGGTVTTIGSNAFKNK